MRHYELSKDEYDFIVNTLLAEREDLLQQISIIAEDDTIKVVMDEDIGDEIRELAGDIVGLHFDENYEPTKIGVILESIIDKLYYN
ncbi:hypothetical protein [uncultured Bacteroides sp.]|uniref:hypothetical protein n=1 Tax=uncultured Bacteroides sp. TaxID=162156 RepID=UPI002AAAFF26|nr:hypothetical protein [uncultured Bacteroides sp.]